MKWIQYKVYTTTDAAEIIGELLCELGIQGFEISDHVPLTPEEEKQMYTDIPADLGPDDGKSVLTFYTEGENKPQEREFYSTGSSLRDADFTPAPEARSPEELIQTLRQRIMEMQQFFPFADPKISYSIQDDSLWKDKWKDSFHPFRVSDDLIVTPVWEAHPDIATAKDTLLLIEPGSAFGTGTHETTRLCMTSLKKYISQETTILDAGCGSGILAIAALLYGAKSAFCLDIDPSAVTGTLENAERNHIAGDRIRAIHGNILEDSASIKAACPEPFDVVVANILADVIIPLAGMIRPFLKPDGVFISSGILTSRGDDVRKALVDNHFTIIEENTLGEWISFVAKP